MAFPRPEVLARVFIAGCLIIPLTILQNHTSVLVDPVADENLVS